MKSLKQKQEKNFEPKKITKLDKITGRIYWKKIQNNLEIRDDEIIYKRIRKPWSFTESFDMAGIKKDSENSLIICGIGYRTYGYTPIGKFDYDRIYIEKRNIKDIPTDKKEIKKMAIHVLDKMAEAYDLGI
ncbi:MAG: hypothetical protein J7L08_00160 [Candidatus Aenigmarchaeota archaeon]|nr:hypothetical protein [Candidatus Aenigmarchaeota archaeon]